MQLVHHLAQSDGHLCPPHFLSGGVAGDFAQSIVQQNQASMGLHAKFRQADGLRSKIESDETRRRDSHGLEAPNPPPQDGFAVANNSQQIPKGIANFNCQIPNKSWLPKDPARNVVAGVGDPGRAAGPSRASPSICPWHLDLRSLSKLGFWDFEFTRQRLLICWYRSQ